VLTGAGDRAFCAGADLKERNTLSEAQWMAQHVIIEEQFKALIECPVPVIAAANGHAFAGGLEMLLACDFAYAVTGARFALTEVTLGLMPGAGGTQTLPRTVGERRAKEIILTGKPFAAAEALEWGVVNALYAPEALMPAALETATRIASNAPIAVKEARRSIHGGLQKDLAAAMRFEIECYNKLVPTEDRREGIRAFNEKRKPEFKGR
jgi:enoyl-CoA hydratase